jgi:pyruvate,orthophosphate dikinase
LAPTGLLITGIAFSRNPETGERALEGEFCHGEGEDVNAGVREPRHINELKTWGATNNEEREQGGPVFQELQRLVTVLENLFGDVQEVEFTVQNGDIFILQSGSATRSPKANVKFAVQMVNEGLITERDALLRVNALQMDYFLKPAVHPELNPDTLAEKLLGTGLPGVSSGAVTGEAVFSGEAADQCFRDGRPCILIRNDASVADLQGIAAADGIICLEGGASSYLVEMCRPLNRTCIVGAKLSGLTLVNQDSSSCAVYDNVGNVAIVEGQIITLDGTTGRILNGPVSA